MLKLSHRRSILRASVIGCLLVAIITTTIHFITNNQNSGNATTRDSDTVTVGVTDNSPIRYGSVEMSQRYTTYHYKVTTVEDATFSAYMLQPENDFGPSTGNAEARGPFTSPDKYDLIKLLIYISQHPNETSTVFHSLFDSIIDDERFWAYNSGLSSDRVYVFTHAVINSIYGREQYQYFDEEHKAQLETAKNTLRSLIQNNNPAWQQAQTYSVFRGVGLEDGKEIVWIEQGGSIIVTKCDFEAMSTCVAQGNANFNGITFTLYRKGVEIASQTLSNGKNTVTFNGLDTRTEYDIIESGSNDYYNNLERHQSITPSLEGATLTFRNTVKRGGFTVNMIDKDTGSCTNSGISSFAGSSFQIINTSTNLIVYQGNPIGSGGVVTARTLSANECSFTIDSLPYGTYQIKETAAASGYALDGTPRTIDITPSSPSVSYNFENQPIRGDVKFTKINKSNGMPMANTIFSISSVDSSYNIKETHIVVTDQNGVVNTSKDVNLHTNHTNGYDELYEGTATEQITYLGYGTWFGLDSSGNPFTPRDDAGALPYGTYIIQELKCDANMFCTDIINQKKTIQITQHGTVVDLGNWDNACAEFTIETNATDKVDGDKFVEANKDAVINDKIAYCAKKDYNFTIKGTLMDKATGEQLLIDGQPVERSMDIKSKEDCDEIELDFNVNTADLAGKEVVVFEYLYHNDDLVAKHENINDEKQTVSIISLETFAFNDENDEKIIPYEAETKIRTDVQYCLKPGLEYTIKGVVMDKNTKGKLLVNGEPIEQEITITPEEACGEIKMYYPINTTNLAGSELVIFNSVYLEDNLILDHNDFDNESASFSVTPIPVPNTGSISEDAKGSSILSSPWVIGVIAIVVPLGLHFANRFYRKKHILNK